MQTKLDRYEAALRGIAACATDCESCRMLAGVAERALKAPVCVHGYTTCKPCRHPLPDALAPDFRVDIRGAWAPDSVADNVARRNGAEVPAGTKVACAKYDPSKYVVDHCDTCALPQAAHGV